MKLDLKGDASKNPVVLVVVIVVILAAVFFLVRSFMGSSGSPAAEPPTGMAFPPGMPPPPGASQSAPGGPQIPPMPPGMAPPAAPDASGGPAQTAAAPTAAPTAAQPSTAKPAQRPAPGPAPAEPAGDMLTSKVFGSVNVSYPKGWGIAPSGSSSVAVFTNRKAYFEVHPPDPKAKTAQAIAQSALAKQGKGAKVVAQGEAKVGMYDAYWYSASSGKGKTRVVGIDGPTRIAVVAYVKSGSFEDHAGTFDKMQSAITFGR